MASAAARPMINRYIGLLPVVCPATLQRRAPCNVIRDRRGSWLTPPRRVVGVLVIPRMRHHSSVLEGIAPAIWRCRILKHRNLPRGREQGVHTMLSMDGIRTG